MSDYREHHPAQALLAIEVSDRTLDEDTHPKAGLYAAAGVADYWVTDVTGRFVMFREPRIEAGQPFGYAYRRVSARGRDDIVSPLSAPDEKIIGSDLLP